MLGFNISIHPRVWLAVSDIGYLLDKARNARGLFLLNLSSLFSSKD
jgi:hypothetical protein